MLRRKLILAKSVITKGTKTRSVESRRGNFTSSRRVREQGECNGKKSKICAQDVKKNDVLTLLR